MNKSNIFQPPVIFNRASIEKTGKKDFLCYLVCFIVYKFRLISFRLILF